MKYPILPEAVAALTRAQSDYGALQASTDEVLAEAQQRRRSPVAQAAVIPEPAG